MQTEPPKREISFCPYCRADLEVGVLSCRHCSRDLTPVLPLLSMISVLESRLLAVEERLASQTSEQPLLASPVGQLVAEPPVPGLRRLSALPAGFLALLAVYGAVVLWLDLPLSVLRLSSIGIPLIAGFVFFGARHKFRWPDGLTAVLFSILSVFSMNLILGMIDSIPVLPRDTAAWRETIYYVLSIAASMTSGMLLRTAIMALGVRGLTSLPRLRQGLLNVNKSIPSETLKAIELVVLFLGAAFSAITGLFAGILGLSG